MQQLKGSSFALLSATGLMPVIAWALVIALALGAAVGGGVVWQWKEGQAAIKENASLRADVKAWEEATKSQQEQQATHVAQLRQASERMATIAQGREDDREELRRLASAQAQALELLRARHPGWAGIDLGPDFVRHWNAANTGLEPPAAPAPEDRKQPAPSVPGAAAPAVGGPGGHPQPARSGGSAPPRLQEGESKPGRGGERVGGDGMAVVLPGRVSDRRGRERMPA